MDSLYLEISDFIETFNDHLARVRKECPPLIPFLDEYFGDDVISLIAQMASEKMKLTLSDGKSIVSDSPSPKR